MKGCVIENFSDVHSIDIYSIIDFKRAYGTCSF